MLEKRNYADGQEVYKDDDKLIYYHKNGEINYGKYEIFEMVKIMALF